jgi:hypothetical protein
MVVVNVSAVDYRSYGEIEGTVNGLKVAGSRIGNIGLLPNSNVEHALQSGLWIDNESTFTFIAPSGQQWSINTLSGYYDALQPDANINVGITLYEQSLITTNFAGDTFTVNNLSLNNCLSTNCIHGLTSGAQINIWNDTVLKSSLSTTNLNFTDSAIVTANDLLWSTGVFLTLNIAGSTLYVPLYNGDNNYYI